MVSVSKEVNPAQQGSATRLELGDSADDEVRVEAAASGVDDSCVSICQRKSLSAEFQFICFQLPLVWQIICDFLTLAVMFFSQKVLRYCILHGQDQDMVQLGSISRTRQSICS